MTYARTEGDYKANRDEFKAVACRDGVSTLWEYFVEKWDSCADIAMSQFDTWWHDMRHGNASMIATRKDTSDDKMDDDEDDSGAAAGSVGGSTPSPKEGVNEGYTRSTSPDSDGDSATPTQVADSPVGSVEIRLNGSAPKVGRPRLKCTKLKQQAKAALKEYNQGHASPRTSTR
ncbi:Ankyrin-2 [Phytophthora nicotianae]|uniref:Ankyrin-2 n=1 Tax=Phytophthora nicotianae TaxID=4792 RepID=A0A0W8CSF9_PHYNI|nr:Ankyrin-2 [Phytophthora nicotianae]